MAEPAYDPTDFGNRPGEGSLRVGGVSLSGLAQDEANLPSTMSQAAKKQVPALAMVRSLWGGTERVRECSTSFLPRSAGEEGVDYQARLQRSVFFAAFRRTVEGLTGLVFRRDPVLDTDVPPLIQEHWENIDGAGTHGDVFLRQQLQDALTAGHNAILVEFPATDGTQTAAQEMALQPYWVPIYKDNILSWRTAVYDGHTVLTQIVLKETSMVPAGAFGEQEQTRYRVLYRNPVSTDATPAVGWVLFEVTASRELRVVSDGYFRNQTEIPLAEVRTSGSRGMFESDPPLLDLAYLNVAHYQQWSDAAWSRFKTCVPILFGAGIQSSRNDDGSPAPAMTVGPNTAIMAPDPSATLNYVAHSGSSLDNCERALETLKSDMGTLGVGMLAPQSRAAETAEAKRLDKTTQDSALSVTARALQDATERALGFHARYLKLESGGSVEINRDYEGLAMDPAVMTALAGLIAQGLPWDLALEELKKGGRIPEDVDSVAVALEIDAARAATMQQKAEEQAQMFGQGEREPLEVEYGENGKPKRLVPSRGV